ncbi:MAG: hypothetical protein R3A48_20000 [Polyangiales bacterium]
MNSLEDRLERIEKKLDALLARQQGAQGVGATAEIDVDIDGPRGDPEVRFMPKRWTGPDHKGQTFSSCEPEFLDLLAEAYEWFAQRDDETGALDKNGSPKSRWSRLDAARARAWAARLRGRDGETASPRRPRAAPADRPRRPAPSRSVDSFDGGDDSEIPF